MYANFNNVIHQTNNNLHSTEKDEEEESEKSPKTKQITKPNRKVEAAATLQICGENEIREQLF